MSAALVGRVLDSALPGNLKPVAIAFAHHAHDDGTSLFPSVERLAWCLNRSSRAVSTAVVQLRRLGVIVPLQGLIEVNGHLQPRGGAGHSTQYRFVAGALPLRLDWQAERVLRSQKGCRKLHPFPTQKGGRKRPERVRFTQERVPKSSSQQSTAGSEKKIKSYGASRHEEKDNGNGAPRAEEVWNLVREQIGVWLKRYDFETWFGETRGVALAGSVLSVCAPELNVRWIVKNYSATLEAALARFSPPLEVQWQHAQDVELATANARR